MDKMEEWLQKIGSVEDAYARGYRDGSRIKLEISDHYDRTELMTILQDNGYRVWLEYDKDVKPTKIYVCVDKEKDE